MKRLLAPVTPVTTAVTVATETQDVVLLAGR